jgi:hypothetical protein
MAERNFFEALTAEYGRSFSGWDFSYVNERMVSDPLPWNYRLVVTDAVSASESLLDMGTGGGEFLDSLPALPPVTFATEGYAPNVPIAKARLREKNVQVVEIAADDVLPFDDAPSTWRSTATIVCCEEVAKSETSEDSSLIRSSDEWFDINASLGAPHRAISAGVCSRRKNL